MASISDKVAQIRQAVYGKDVRESIADGIEAINSEVETTTAKQAQLETTFEQLIINAGNSNAEIVDARGGFDTLRKKLDSYAINVKDFGAKGDGVTDDTAAIQAAINFVKENYGGGIVFIPPGVYVISQPIIIQPYILLTGSGVNSSIIKITNDITAIKAPQVYLHLFKISNLQITGTNNGDLTLFNENNCGIDLSDALSVNRALIEFVWIKNVNGHGIRILNEFDIQISHVFINEVSGHGIFLNGGNSTVLSNCYVGTIGNNMAGYRIWNKAILIGCTGLDKGDYWGVFGAITNEDGKNLPADIELIGCNIEEFYKTGIVIKSGQFALRRCKFLATGQQPNFDYYIEINDSTPELCIIDSQTDFLSNGAAQTYPQMIKTAFVSAKILYLGSKNLTYGNGSTVLNVPRINITYPAYNTTAITLSSAVIDKMEYYYLGNKKHSYGTQPPTSGTWNVGDIIYNTSPTPGGYVGWVCVQAGTPGIWKGFGTIAS